MPRDFGTHAVRTVRRQLLVLTAALLLSSTAGCSATDTPGAVSTAPAVPVTAPVTTATPADSTTSAERTPSAPATEPLPSLLPESAESDATSVTVRRPDSPAVQVKAPTLGANFTGDGDWHANPGTALTSVTLFSHGRRATADIAFTPFAVDGTTGLVYLGGSITPSGTYFTLNDAACVGQPVPATRPGETCAFIRFEPTSEASAANPSQATLKLQVELSCAGQDHPLCRDVGAATSPGSPVTVTFSQSVALSEMIGCGPSAPTATTCGTDSTALPDEPPVSDDSRPTPTPPDTEPAAPSTVGIPGTPASADSDTSSG